MHPSGQPHFLYFAYGSNLLTQRLRERTPSAVKVASGILHRHELCWHKSAADGSGKCDVTASPNDTSLVYGVIYRIHVAEKSILDLAETLGIGYAEKQVSIETSSGRLQALLYFALKIDPDAIPYDWYHQLVVAGAREHNFPARYLTALAAVLSKPDADEARSKHHFDLIADAS
jgi:gamma-glutamylcyclotransferase